MKTIGLFFETNCEFGREFLRGVAQYAHECRDWRLKLLANEVKVSRDAFQDCDGIIARVGEEKTLNWLKGTGAPLVDAFCQAKDPWLPGVDTDQEAIAKMAAEHFMRHMFKSFTFCGYTGSE